MLRHGLHQGVGLVRPPPGKALLGPAARRRPGLDMARAGLGREHGAAAHHGHGVAAAADQHGPDAPRLGRQGGEPGDGVAAASGPAVHRPRRLQQRHGAVRGTQLQAGVELLLGQRAVARGEALHPARQPGAGDERHTGLGGCHGAGLRCEVGVSGRAGTRSSLSMWMISLAQDGTAAALSRTTATPTESGGGPQRLHRAARSPSGCGRGRSMTWWASSTSSARARRCASSPPAPTPPAPPAPVH